MKSVAIAKSIIPLASKDQHFCIDESILNLMVDTAQITKTDVILEIGAGRGNLTAKLAKRSQKVIAVENDPRFEPVLRELGNSVEIIIDNALQILPVRTDFNKIVASIPYQICEPLMHFLCAAKPVELSVLLVPKNFAVNLLKHPIFSAFLKVNLIAEVPKQAFIPPPRVLSEIILIVPRMNLDEGQFIRQKLYLQRDKNVKNGLRDAIIDLYKKKHRQPFAKKQALEIAASLKLPDKLLAASIARMPLQWYELIGREIKARNI
ncbi:hypothetical protein J4479_03450 [Candidatus Woesearchaeota archaeon]|nr:hypothetical protein [Candidatus Woesearchaeota archaeon]